MDPVSQSVWGAVWSGAAARKKTHELRQALFVGAVAGTLADLDVFIRSETDPLLSIEYHRHFTHSLIFTPVGALVAIVLIKIVFRLFRISPLSAPRLYLYAALGYASHGLLDAATSYGTQLLWPFSNARIAWNIIAIVDPFFTLPLIALTICAFWKRSGRIALSALIWGLSYLGLGAVQRERAEAVALDFAASRNHQDELVSYDAKPSPLSLFLWRTTYRTTEDIFYVDAVYVGPLGGITRYEGESIARFSPERDAPWLAHAARQRRDLERFRWFSSDHIALHPNAPSVVADIRYSMIPNRIEPLWGIELDPDNLTVERPTPFRTYRSISTEDRELFWRMVRGRPLIASSRLPTK